MRSVCLAGGGFPEQTDLRKGPFAPLGRRIRPSDVRFRVVPAHPEWCTPFARCHTPAQATRFPRGRRQAMSPRTAAQWLAEGITKAGLQAAATGTGVKRVRQPQPTHRNAQLTWC